jgi:hypothetical protein
MVRKQADGKPLPRPRLSLASRLLCSALRANVLLTPPEEPWRNQRPQGKQRARRNK